MEVRFGGEVLEEIDGIKLARADLVEQDVDAGSRQYTALNISATEEGQVALNSRTRDVSLDWADAGDEHELLETVEVWHLK
jgi:hypothetical protein